MESYPIVLWSNAVLTQFEKQLKFLSKMIAISTRIDDMFEEIETIVFDKIRISKQYCFQLDEYTDIGKNTYCRFLLLYKSGVP